MRSQLPSLSNYGTRSALTDCCDRVVNQCPLKVDTAIEKPYGTKHL